MLLFLDFDGVLHPNNCGDSKMFSRVALLWQILRTCPSVKVVFSTSWREICSFEELIVLVTKNGGEDLASRFIDITPILRDEGNFPRRDKEIQNWIKTNGYSCMWLAIDDMPQLFNGHPNLYIIDGNRGMTIGDVEAIIEEFK